MGGKILNILLILAIVFGVVAFFDECWAENNLQKDTKTLFEEANKLIRYYQGKSEDLRKAYEYLSEVITREPNFGEAYAKMAELYIVDAYQYGSVYDLAIVKKAEQWLKKAQEISPDAAFVDGAYSLFYFAKKDYDTAIEKAESAINKEPTNPDWHFRLARTYSANKKYKKAIQSFNNALKLTKEDRYRAKIYSKLGDEYWDIEDFTNATDSYDNAIKLEPNSPWTFNNYGAMFIKAFLKEKKEEYLVKAAEILKRALLLMDFQMAHMNLARAYGFKGRVSVGASNKEEAKQFYEMSIAQYPSFDWVHYELGRLYEAEDNLTKAEKEYIQTFNINPNYSCGLFCNIQDKIKEIRRKIKESTKE